MENASKALLIAGAILLAILIIAIGMFIYNSAQATVTDSITSMSTSEIEAFNNNFSTYEQKQSGSNVKALIGRMIANAKTYIDEPGKCPKIQYVQGSKNTPASFGPTGTTEGQNQEYINALSNLRSQIENKHTYNVTMAYGESGIIAIIQVDYGNNGTFVAAPTITGK